MRSSIAAGRKNLSFRYIVTTGNEACLETFDFVDYMLDEGKTDAFLLLLEDVKNVATFERVAAKALRAGKPLIVSKLGQSEAGSRAVRSHTAAQAGSHADYRAMFARYGVIEGRDLDRDGRHRGRGFSPFGSRLPAGRRVGICTSSGGGGAWLADACVAAGLDVPELDAETRAVDRRASALLRHLAESGRRDRPGRARSWVMPSSPAWSPARPRSTASSWSSTGRSPRLLMRDRETLDEARAREPPSRS